MADRLGLDVSENSESSDEVEVRDLEPEHMETVIALEAPLDPPIRTINELNAFYATTKVQFHFLLLHSDIQ